ncbi:MAG: hypothetical protein JW751_03940 [Polyangiaceae bacterium]|nr:hypothetical protein [Polyangiaceae bacterium]
MGWLRDLMAEAIPPVRSFGELARNALADPDWPSDNRPLPRSLEAILGKLDRNLELGWLGDRPAVRNALARALSCCPEDLDQAVARARPETARHEGRIRLHALPFGRAIDLRTEELPPGIPTEVLHPARWARLWWQAPSGSGRSLVGEWLRARGLAEFVDTPATGDPLVGGLRGRPRFIELHRTNESRPLVDQSVCVAAPFPPLNEGFAVVRSPPVGTFLRELLEWIAARLPHDSSFDPERALVWFERERLARGLTDTVGTVIGICGALDEVGFRTAIQEPLGALVRALLDRRIAELTERGHTDAPWLRRAAQEVLVGLAARLLGDPTAAWHEPRSLDDWLALIPDEFQRDVDVDWMRALLATADGPIRARDVERAARRLPPGAFRIVRGLSAAGFLTTTGPSADLALRPLWLGQTLVDTARQRLVRGSPLAYGAALLSPEAADSVAEELLHRLRADDLATIEDVLDLDPDESAAASAALEAVFRVAGIAVLEGSELPTELLGSLASEQLRLLTSFEGGLPTPRVGHRARAGSLLSDATFWLAALAITETLGSGRGHSALEPWRAPSPPPGLRELLDAVASELPAFTEPRAIETFALVDRLRRVLGELAEPCHPLERPGAVLDELALGVPEWQNIAAIGEVPHGYTAVAVLAERRGMAWSDVAREIWTAFITARCPVAGARALDRQTAFGAELWRAVPTEVWAELIARDEPDLDFTHADQATVHGLTARLPDVGPRVSEAFWNSAPSAAAEAALAHAPPTTTIAATRAWTRAPAAVIAALPELVTRPADLSALLAAAPIEQTAAIATVVETVRRDSIPDRTLREISRWAHARVAMRAPEYGRAFSLLVGIEQDLARVTRRDRGHAQGHRS